MSDRDDFRRWWQREGTHLMASSASIQDLAEQVWLAARGQQSDPCADGFCPVELFRPIDETEGSN